MKKMVALLLAVVLVMSSTSVFAAGANKKFTGEQIFRGLIFGQGEVAQLFPQIWSKQTLAKLNNKQAIEATDTVVNQVKQIEPGYFAELEKAVYSGNHVQVRAVLAKGADVVEKAAKSLQVNTNVGTGTGTCAVAAWGWLVYLGAVFTTGAAVTHVAVVNAAGGITVYLAVVAGKYFWTSSVSAQDASLKQDIIVNSVVKAFAK